MSFNSLNYILFFIAVVIIYYIIPASKRYIWLLLSSYLFYATFNIRHIILLLVVTAITYFAGLQLEKKQSKVLLACTLLVCFGLLIGLKYFNFFGQAILGLVNIFRTNKFDYEMISIIIPAGISYYIFEATSYLIDIYYKKTRAQHNFLKYALFVSYFPKLISGPIEKEKDFNEQIENPKKFKYENFESGFLLFVWGLFLKIVIADRISIFVNIIYDDINVYGGLYLIIATLAYAFQIYCDFSGYTIMAIGFSKILGIDLMDNFNAPYLSCSTIEFWKKWHISLTSWLRDYIYIPLGGNRKGILRKYINIFIVFLISGIWHGSSFNFLVWGAINGIYQIIGYVLKPYKIKIYNRLKIDVDCIFFKTLQTVITFCLIAFSWIFFRANTFEEALTIVSSILHTNNLGIIFDYSIFECGLDRGDALILFISLAIVLFAEIQKTKGYSIREKIMKLNPFAKSVIIAGSFCLILLFGKWGPSFDASSFIYANF